jgi:predicted metal-binding transcription factor (methanogenesis marker protein 9)
VKFSSYILLLYLSLLVIAPEHLCFHGHEDPVSHEQTETEATCCPPFSFCKVCPNFMLLPSITLVPEGSISYLQFFPVRENLSKVSSFDIPVWQPPRLI